MRTDIDAAGCSPNPGPPYAAEAMVDTRPACPFPAARAYSAWTESSSSIAGRDGVVPGEERREAASSQGRFGTSETAMDRLQDPHPETPGLVEALAELVKDLGHPAVWF